ncbi:MAG: cupin domain-containing protein [Bacteroidales bacterium]
MSEFPKGRLVHLSQAIEYSEGSVVSKQIIKCGTGNITLFAFEKGEGLSEHTTPYDALVQVLEGEVEITIDQKAFHLKSGDSILLPANHPHKLHASERFKMLLTMIRG